MTTIKKITLTALMGMVSGLYAYEPSAYGAGNLDSATPYGLTPTEQAVLENKQTLQILYNKVNEQQNRIDGLTTIIEGQNQEILQLKEQLQLQVQTQSSTQTTADSNQTYSLLLELSRTVDNINNSYVTRDELKKALAGSRLGVSSSGSSTGSSLSKSNAVLGNSADIYTKGVQLFATRSYKAAKEQFEMVLSRNYKPAATNYYLGEIAYYTHDYSNAVAYYKESAAQYADASYMDVLYLHTAISLDNIGQKDQAKGFYQFVIEHYPNKKSAAIAKSKL